MNGPSEVVKEVESVKVELPKHIADPRAKFSLHTARTPGSPVGGVTRAMCVQPAEFAAGTLSQVAFGHLYAQVLPLPSTCHGGHVGVTTEWVMALDNDVQRLSQLNGLTAAPCA